GRPSVSMTFSIPRSGERRGERGMTLIEVLAAMAIGSLMLSTIYLAVGTAVRSRLRVMSTLQNQQHGRLVVQWLGDRLRQAGYAVSYTSSIPRCRDALVVEDPTLNPTSAQLYFNTDLAADGTPETIGFSVGLETVGSASVNVVRQSVTDCATGATEQVASVTDPTSVRVTSLSFAYYDANGAAVTDLTTPTGIRSIRMIRITLVEEASAGAQGTRSQTWTILVNLRNPDPRTL
ncbi:MAG: PulJ/GspJ family protein, partial [Armatimonadota bacterium]